MEYGLRYRHGRAARHRAALQIWLSRFLPSRLHASPRERVFGSLGAGLGILGTAGISQLAWGAPEAWFMAPMGAVAILLFAVPSSQLAQPWPTLAGNLMAALIGVLCARHIGSPWLAGACALTLSLACMFAFHCLHPPAGGVALMAVFGGEPVRELGFGFVWWPVGVSVLLMLAVALAFNVLTRRNYPTRQRPAPNPHQTRDLPAGERVGPSASDLERSLEEHAQVLDISLSDLQTIVQAAEVRAHQRRLGELRCRDVMSRDLIGVAPDSLVGDAWSRLVHHRFRAMPVIRDDGTLAGIVSLRDFLNAAQPGAEQQPPCWAAEYRVRDIMTSQVQTAHPEQPIAELVPWLGGGGLHQVPVVDQEEVVGIVSQSDLVAALFEQGLRRSQ